PGSGGNGLPGVVERQHRPVPPHVRLPVFQAVARPGSRFIEVVAGNERRPAAAQMMTTTGIERGCPAGDGALEMRKARSGQGVNRRSLGYFATLESAVDSDFRDQLRMFLIA